MNSKFLLDDIPFCQEFRPSEEEFSDFETCVEKYEKMCSSGMMKIIPPPSFCARKAGYEKLDIRLTKPIEQNVTGESGIYSVINYEMNSLTIEKYRANAIKNDQNIGDDESTLKTERLFWKTLRYNPPTYGADVLCSIFDPNLSWGLKDIKSLLKDGLNGCEIRGVTQPYIYAGSWKTLFSWHKEDMDLYAINYLHCGKIKLWYCVHYDDTDKFEDLAKSFYPDAYKTCSEFMRHKTFLFSPLLLLKHGVRVTKCAQKEGEFIITLPRCYHSGFNFGFNLAESVNFAMPKWLDFLPYARNCKCRRGSVYIDYNIFMSNLSLTDKYSSIVKERGWSTLKEVNESTDVDPNEEAKTAATANINNTFTFDETEAIEKDNLQKRKRKRPNPNNELDFKYVIDKWVQCDKCKKWRIIKNENISISKHKSFYCAQIGVMCKTPQVYLDFEDGISPKQIAKLKTRERLLKNIK